MADPKPLVLTTGGIGPIQTAFPPDQPTLESLFPGCTVAKGSYYFHGRLEPGSYQVSRGGKLLLTVQPLPGRGIEVAVVSPKVALPGGSKLGSTYAAVEKKLGAKLTCQEGTDELSDNLVCTAEALPRISWIFARPGVKPPEAGPSAATIRREEFVLSSVRWTLAEKGP